MRQYRRVYDLEVNVSSEKDISPYDRHDAIVLGLTRVVKTLAAAVYASSEHRDAIEQEFRDAIAEENPQAVPPSTLNLYRAPIAGVLAAIEDLKKVLPKEPE